MSHSSVKTPMITMEDAGALSSEQHGGMSIEEYVARAIFDAALYSYSWSTLTAAGKNQFLSQARAALRAQARAALRVGQGGALLVEREG